MGIQNPLPILQSKLTIPHFSHTIDRERLIQRLGAITHKKLALVIAGAGYGKTTLAAQTVSQLPAHTIWYSLDDLDKDPAMFLGHLLAGLQAHYPDLGTELWPKLPALAVCRQSRENLLLSLLVEIEQNITRPLVIVLDDFYRVGESREIAGILEFLLPRMAAGMHFILISRMAPELKLSRYRAMLEVIELTEEDLAFRKDEVEALYLHLLKMDLTPAQIQSLHKKTGGWAAALLLFFNAAKENSNKSGDQDLLDIGRSEELIFKYLEENIFDVQSKEIQRFLMRSSLLEQLDPDFCDTVFKMQESRVILDTLARNRLLTFPCDPRLSRYEYHHLLRGFLQNRLKATHGGESVNSLHKIIARTMETDGDLYGALRHYRQGKHFEEIARLLSSLMLLDFKDMPISFLKDLIGRIPDAYIRQNARVLYIRAKVMSVSGDIRKAIDEFKTALNQFRVEGNDAGMTACLKDIGFHYYLTGDLQRATREMEALWGHAHTDPFFPVEVAGYLILFYAIMGDIDTSDRYYHDAVNTLAASDNMDSAFIRTWFGLCRGYRFHVTGHFSRADKLNTHALDFFTRSRMEIILPITCFQTALTTYYLADPAKGCRYARKGLSIARKQGIFDNQYAWLLYALALNESGEGRTDEALLHVQEALDLFQVYDNAWGQALAHDCRGMIFSGQEKWDQALDAFNTGMGVVDTLDLRRAPGQGALALGLAEALMGKGRFDQAQQTLDKYSGEIRISRFHQFCRHLLEAGILDATDDIDGAVAHLNEALAISKSHSYQDWMRIPRPWLLPLLVECYHRGQNREDVEQLFLDAGREGRAALNLLKSNKKTRHLRRSAERLIDIVPHEVPSPLDIRCLGNFSVAIGDRPIHKNQWRSAKAALLFKYMAVHHDRGMISSERLLELAWPDEDERVTRPRLHVALNALRKLLEPELVRGVPSAYIIRRNNSYRLEIGRDGRIDLIAFTKAAEAAGTVFHTDPDMALRRLVEAAAIYRGPLLEEDPYAQWVTEHRRRLKKQYLQVLSDIMKLYRRQESWHQCIAYADAYLQHDPYAEPVYRDLMGFHSKAGNSGGVLDAFEQCRRRIKGELDCQLSEDTINLQKQLIKG